MSIAAGDKGSKSNLFKFIKQFNKLRQKKILTYDNFKKPEDVIYFHELDQLAHKGPSDVGKTSSPSFATDFESSIASSPPIQCRSLVYSITCEAEKLKRATSTLTNLDADLWVEFKKPRLPEAPQPDKDVETWLYGDHNDYKAQLSVKDSIIIIGDEQLHREIEEKNPLEDIGATIQSVIAYEQRQQNNSIQSDNTTAESDGESVESNNSFVESGSTSAKNDDGSSESENNSPKSDASDLETRKYLNDDPDLKNKVHTYYKKWQSWQKQRQYLEPFQHMYSRLFSISQKIKNDGDAYEVILAAGLLNKKIKVYSKTKSGQVVEKPVLRHIATTPCEVKIENIKTGTIKITPREEGVAFRLEADDILSENDLPSENLQIASDLEKTENTFWQDNSLKYQLESWITALDAEAQFQDTVKANKHDSEHPILSWAPALICRKRSHRSFVDFCNKVIRLEEGGQELTGPAFNTLFSSRAGSDDTEKTSSLEAHRQVEHYFPLPSNKEQKKIINLYRKNALTLVQGPPGTGKTHSIANVMSHLLSEGKKILVTSEKDRALKVLKSKLPPSIQHLCVETLGRDTGAFSKQKESINSINHKKTYYDKSNDEEKVQKCYKNIEALKSQKKSLQRAIKSLHAFETHKYYKKFNHYDGTAACIAEKTKKQEAEFGWIKNYAPDLAPETLFRAPAFITRHKAHELIQRLKNINHDAKALSSGAVGFVPQLPVPDQAQDSFKQLLIDEVEAQKNLHQSQSVLDSTNEKHKTSLAALDLSRLSPTRFNELYNILSQLDAAIQDLTNRGTSFAWAQRALQDCLSGHDDRKWRQRHSTLQHMLSAEKDLFEQADALPDRRHIEQHTRALNTDETLNWLQDNIPKHQHSGDLPWYKKSFTKFFMPPGFDKIRLPVILDDPFDRGGRAQPADAFQAKGIGKQRIEGQKLESRPLDHQMLENQNLEGQRLDSQSLENQKLENRRLGNQRREKIRHISQLKMLERYLRARKTRGEIKNFIQEFADKKINSNSFKEFLSVCEDAILEPLEQCSMVFTALEKVESIFKAHDSDKGCDTERFFKSIRSDVNQVQHLFRKMSVTRSQNQLQRLKNKFESIKQILTPYENQDNGLARKIKASVTDRGLDSYLQHYNESALLLRDQNEYLSIRKELKSLFDSNKDGNPSDNKWIDYFLQSRSDSSVASRWLQIEATWAWWQAVSWLNHNQNQDLNRLEQQLLDVEKDIHKNIEKLVEIKSWGHCLEHITPEQQSALKAWAHSVKKIGKGTGKQAPKYRREAREYLSQCMGVVPAWVMPLARVVESFDPMKHRFDVVIIDEASQTGPNGFLLHTLAQKIIVIGDNEQISPENVGTKAEDVDTLRKEYLQGFQNDKIVGADSSYYDWCEVTFHSEVTLREHFRCVPEIIAFSNKISYSDQNKQLHPMRCSSSAVLKPLDAVFVEGGEAEKKGSHPVNRQEAKALVQHLAQCLKDEKYKDKSFGIISLQGPLQVQAIEQELNSLISPEEIENREIQVGDAYDFQGDERHVIFLSLIVDDNYKKQALTKESYKKRYNVAASRAQDQMVLFHSIQLSYLNKEDYRFKLLDHCKHHSSQNIFKKDIVDKVKKAEVEVEDKSPRNAPEPFDSWMEARVFCRLAEKGYKVIPQYKVSGYSLDLVVEGERGQLAIECDGDIYHADEHEAYDEHRQMTLERCGWRFWRVRSSEFYGDREAALEPLWKKLDEMKIYPRHYKPSEADTSSEAGSNQGQGQEKEQDRGGDTFI